MKLHSRRDGFRTSTSLGRREWLWIAVIFLLALAWCCRTGLSSLLFLAAAVLIMPIEGLRQTIYALNERIFRKAAPTAAKILPTVLILLGFLAAAGSGSGKITERAEAVTSAAFRTKAEISAEPEALPLLEIDFLDVGQADCALVRCGGHAMLIDGGGRERSSQVYAFLKERDVDYLDYIIVTHLHEDHIGGIAGALNRAEVGTLYCSGKSSDMELYQDMVRYLNVQGKKVTVPKNDETFALGGAQVELFVPTEKSSDENNNSLIVRITFGENSFLFMGDAEADEENAVISAGHILKSDVIKLAHHGSSTATSYRLLTAVYPKYAVISAGEGNPYGHPAAQTLLRLQDARVTTYRTDRNRMISCRSDGKTVTFTVERECTDDPLVNYTPEAGASAAPETTAEATPAPIKEIEPTEEGNESSSGKITRSTQQYDYIANRNSLVFHKPGCSTVKKMKEENKLFFSGTREELIEGGYKPCGVCKP